MSEHRQRICALAEEAASEADPESALRTLVELRRELDAFVGVQVERGLAAGASFADVARALGISRQAAHRRFRDLAPEQAYPRPRRLVASEQARRVMRLAQAEATAAGAPAGSRHLLLGILQTDSETARALQHVGVTLETARACGEAAAPGDHVTSTGLRPLVQQAGRIALARGDAALGLEQLLLAALAAPDGGAVRTLTALGTTPAAIRARMAAGHGSSASVDAATKAV